MNKIIICYPQGNMALFPINGDSSTSYSRLVGDYRTLRSLVKKNSATYELALITVKRIQQKYYNERPGLISLMNARKL